MKRKRKLNIKKILVIFLIIIIIIIMPVLGRFTYNSIKEAYLKSKNYYFTSNIIGEDDYTYTNWGGSETYVINFELYSYENPLRVMKEDLDCTIRAEITSEDEYENKNATCYIVSGGSSSGTATSSTLNKTITCTENSGNNMISVSVYVIPNGIISIGDEIELTITAETTTPFSKILSSQITITATDQSNYEIRDEAQKDYAELILSNSKEQITTVTLQFNPSVVRIDSYDKIFENRTTSYNTTTINSVDYINSVEFELAPETEKKIKFYKTDISSNYKYIQNNNNYSTSIITVSY